MSWNPLDGIYQGIDTIKAFLFKTVDWVKKEYAWVVALVTWILTPFKWLLDYISGWFDSILEQLENLRQYVEQTGAFDAPVYFEGLLYYAGICENVFPLRFALTTLTALIILAVVCVVFRYFKRMIPFFGK